MTTTSAFDRAATAVTQWVGTPVAFMCALSVVLAWAIAGPFVGFSETWQLLINTGTTIATFLMVFLLQQSQNKDSLALHVKLDELLRAHKDASNTMLGIEDLSEAQLRSAADRYAKLADAARTHSG